jgi:DNA-binding transcriptional MerR regulator
MLPIDAARHIGCSAAGIVYFAKIGALPVAAKTLHGHRLFDPGDVERFKRERQSRRETSERKPDQEETDKCLKPTPSAAVS